MPKKYEGWSNSATYLAAFYMRQEAAVYNRIASMMTRVAMTAETMACVMASVVVRKKDVEDDMICGVVGNILYLDSWAEGSVNWQEIAASCA